VEYRVLGPLEAMIDGRSVPLGPPKQRAVLAILVLHAGDIVSTDQLIDLAWGEQPPRTATHSIQIYVSDLRRVLERDGEPAAILTRPPGYELTADPDTIDARRFERLLRRGARDLEAGDPAAAALVTREALGLWRGAPLSDFAYEEFAQADIRRLEALHIDALEQLAAAELESGQERAALTAIGSAIDEDPLRERSRELQIVALYRAGRRPEALRAYEAFRALLADELGLEPSPALRQLQERVLVHDPGLGQPVVSATVPAASSVLVRNPYKGLRPFGEGDVADFFGREPLVAELVAALDAGARLLALVGPSGLGKSSVIDAGLLPALRGGALPGSAGWLVAQMMPGEHPFEELEGALGRAAPSSSAEVAAVLEEDRGDIAEAVRRFVPEGDRLLLIIDQFEELFSVTDEGSRERFLDGLTDAVTAADGRVTVVLTLRADFYDRPLLHAGFASEFARGVLTVVPMSADGLESAVVEPARRVGVEVEPALLGQLMAEMSDQPGALPLLEYTLTELFDRRASSTLTLDGYRAVGGLHGALSRRAEDVYGHLADGGQQVALQVFLRLVRLGEGARHSRRRVPVRELTALELDPVALSEVLEGFGRHRLLFFDRDPVSGDATLEVAHEALLSQWERLAGWIDRYRVDLRQHDALVAAADEWESSGREPDYLLIGSRLTQYEAWSGQTVLQLTLAEREFLAAGIARRRAEEADEAARRERQRGLERRARWRLWALLGSIALLSGLATFGILSWLGNAPPDVALLFEGTGDAGFGDMAAAGFDRAVAELGLDARTSVAKMGTPEAEGELRRLSQGGAPLVVVGFGWPGEQATAAVAARFPATRYVEWEALDALPGNVTNITFRSEEGAYLAGAAAALKSRTGIIGFVGAWEVPIVQGFLAGYEAGARSVDPRVEVRAAYLTPPNDSSAFASPTLGAGAAARLYADGADVILAAAGTSNYGVFERATAASDEEGRQLWAIGVDTDEYESVLADSAGEPDGTDPTAWQAHILTSVTKRLDVAFDAVLHDFAHGDLAPGQRSFGLAEGGVEISYSGGFIDDIRPQLDALRARIIAGEIAVPTVPTETVGTPSP
jgi:basic membrane lipoprotein Med (substrate-binding protein (PBP1-ABC) superfamily)/DNA-binding SARP family transcriptional activator